MSADSWLPVVVAGTAAFASVVAAVVAGSFAWFSRRWEAREQNLREIEARISERKYEIYKPQIELLYRMFTSDHVPTGDEQRARESFTTWIGIYGSDDAVTAYHHFMQALYNGAPGDIHLRLFGDFVGAARRDMGNPASEIGRRELLGMRMADIYRRPDLTEESLSRVCERNDWQPPWPAP